MKYLSLLLVWGAVVPVLAQDDLINEYQHASTAVFAPMVFQVFLAVLYILFFAAALVISLSYLKVFNGFDAELAVWIGALWLGGMGITWGLHRVLPHPWAVVAALPLLFGWSFFINTRTWADLRSRLKTPTPPVSAALPSA